MPDEDNAALGVNKDHMGYALATVLLEGLRASTVVVFGRVPALVVTVLDNGASLLVDADTDDAHLAVPVGTSLLEHLLIVSHGLLARRAPGGPEVK